MNEYQHSAYADEFKRRASEEWQTTITFLKGKGPPPLRPYQVEVHPHVEGSAVCDLRCIDCHGQFQRRPGGLPRDAWFYLLDDLKAMKVPSLVISGNYSDPTTDKGFLEEFLREVGPTWGVKLHTYGLNLSSSLRQAIIEAADADPMCDSYVTISKLTTNSEVYQRMCRPVAGRADVLLQQEQDRLKSLFQEAHGRADPLTLRLNCRVTRLNGEPTQLADLLRWLDQVSPVIPIRFTTDYEPHYATPAYLETFYREVYLDQRDAEHRVLEAVALTGFPASRVSFRSADLTTYAGSCYSCLLFSCIGASGQVFQCQGLASPAHPQLICGDLRQERFSAIWQKFVGAYPTGRHTECKQCVAECERQINATLAQGLTDATG